MRRWAVAGRARKGAHGGYLQRTEQGFSGWSGQRQHVVAEVERAAV